LDRYEPGTGRGDLEGSLEGIGQGVRSGTGQRIEPGELGRTAPHHARHYSGRSLEVFGQDHEADYDQDQVEGILEDIGPDYLPHDHYP